MRPGGVAELPLHGGHVPEWLARYMKRLAAALLEAMVELYGPRRVVELLSDPIGFQAFNNAIGMDWDSSGSTTVTIGILREVVRENPGLGVFVAGGKGRLARSVLGELEEAARQGFRGVEEAAEASRLAAKTDSVLLQDGYTLYHHAVVLSSDGAWAIVQQGMNPEARLARRYHWRWPLRGSEPSLEPHSGIAAARREALVEVNLVSRESREARKTMVEIAVSTPPRLLARRAMEAYRLLRGDTGLLRWIRPVRDSIDSAGLPPVRVYWPQARPPRDLEKRLRVIHEAGPSSIEELVMLPGVGPATVRSIALVAELIHGVPLSHRDPADAPLDPFRYAYIAGGKDGVPFPFRRDYAEKVIQFLQRVVEEARLGEEHRRRVIARIERLASLLEKPGIRRGSTSLSTSL